MLLEVGIGTRVFDSLGDCLLYGTQPLAWPLYFSLEKMEFWKGIVKVVAINHSTRMNIVKQ